VLLNTQTTTHRSHPLFPSEISQDKNRKHLVIGSLGRGESFGEHSAISDLPNPFSVEAQSHKVEVYKVLRAHFIKYFGGLQGEPVERLKAQILLKQNWLSAKKEILAGFNVEQLKHNLEYRDEA